MLLVSLLRPFDFCLLYVSQSYSGLVEFYIVTVLDSVLDEGVIIVNHLFNIG